jgi:8-oxo-dGTP diphosphatase
MNRVESYLATGILFIKDDKILLMHRSGTGYADGYYAFVGGKCDKGETIIENAIRECYEEVGAIVAPEDLQFAHVIHRIDADNDKNWVLFFFVVEKWQGEITNREPDKHDELAWFPLTALPEPMVPTHLQTLIEISNNRHFSIYRQEIV